MIKFLTNRDGSWIERQFHRSIPLTGVAFNCASHSNSFSFESRSIGGWFDHLWWLVLWLNRYWSYMRYAEFADSFHIQKGFGPSFTRFIGHNTLVRSNVLWHRIANEKSTLVSNSKNCDAVGVRDRVTVTQPRHMGGFWWGNFGFEPCKLSTANSDIFQSFDETRRNWRTGGGRFPHFYKLNVKVIQNVSLTQSFLSTKDGSPSVIISSPYEFPNWEFSLVTFFTFYSSFHKRSYLWRCAVHVIG